MTLIDDAVVGNIFFICYIKKGVFFFVLLLLWEFCNQPNGMERAKRRGPVLRLI